MSGDYETYEWYTTPHGDFRVEQKRFGTWTNMVRMVRLSSQDSRKKLSLTEQDSTWKVSQPTGQMLDRLNRLMEQ